MDGRIVPSAIVHCDPITKIGEFEPVGTHQNYWQRGLAKALLLTGLNWMKGVGMATAVIRTGNNNLLAQRAYHSVGFQIVDRLYRYQKRQFEMPISEDVG